MTMLCLGLLIIRHSCAGLYHDDWMDILCVRHICCWTLPLPPLATCHNYVQWNPSKPDSDGPGCTVLYSEVSAFQGVSRYRSQWRCKCIYTFKTFWTVCLIASVCCWVGVVWLHFNFRVCDQSGRVWDQATVEGCLFSGIPLYEQIHGSRRQISCGQAMTVIVSIDSSTSGLRGLCRRGGRYPFRNG